MSDKDHLMEYAKYIPTLNWLNELTLSNPFAYNDFMKNVKEQVIKISGCSSQRYDELKKLGFDMFIFDEEDRQLIDLYWEYLESIRKSI